MKQFLANSQILLRFNMHNKLTRIKGRDRDLFRLMTLTVTIRKLIVFKARKASLHSIWVINSSLAHSKMFSRLKKQINNESIDFNNQRLTMTQLIEVI